MHSLVEQQQRRARYVLAGLLSVLLVVAVISLSSGERWISPWHWLSADNTLFVWQIRLPRMVAVVLTGAALAVSGTMMQALFDNPLAEPGLLGVSNGAGLGLVSAMLLGQGHMPDWVLGISSMVGALLITLLLLRFARRRLTTSRLLLAGVALSIICSALMTWAVYFTTSADLRQLMYWMMGGFGGVDWRAKGFMLAIVPVLWWVIRQWRPLNMLALGETPARQLGLALHRWRWVLVVATGWLVGASVALAGSIGFIGLVIPHLLRLCGITDHKTLLPASALAGGVLLLIADMVARLVLASAELPVGVVTASLGAPLFIWLLLKVRHE
ncbi:MULTISPECIES: vitamin B12 ABC transporter permease BtuC [Mangrovibacter]|uniref:Vitamin B12 import system permease protein BtuC n=1 Tax=Mangrovibacter plantisponsor TaxID=451513 RepID=A0A317PUB8_9ENTR|nr:MULTISPECIES: vitamin B12 ABC transporter permease BtuC [Mangrovibacter]KEA52841.1 hypothetical protein DT73_12175 [Mangrovibacter sp. MFB070]PWW05808.1 vitamin B12 transport system permease protein [Mangrovibacter plantisponsor]